MSNDLRKEVLIGFEVIRVKHDCFEILLCDQMKVIVEKVMTQCSFEKLEKRILLRCGFISPKFIRNHLVEFYDYEEGNFGSANWCF